MTTTGRGSLVVITICDCPNDKHHQHTQPNHPQYTRATISSILTLAGLKPRHAYRVRDSLFAALAAAVQAHAQAHTNPHAPIPVTDHATAQHNTVPTVPTGTVPTLVDAVQLPNEQWRVVVARRELERIVLQLLDAGDGARGGDPAAVLFGGVETLRVACRYVVVVVQIPPALLYTTIAQHHHHTCHHLSFPTTPSHTHTHSPFTPSVREHRASVCILLCGTSGTGKSTLASLTAQRLGITTVVSTDSVRNMLRGFVDEERHPLLWVSTYEVGEYLAAQQLPEWRGLMHDPRLLTVKGYKAQCEMVSVCVLGVLVGVLGVWSALRECTGCCIDGVVYYGLYSTPTLSPLLFISTNPFMHDVLPPTPVLPSLFLLCHLPSPFHLSFPPRTSPLFFSKKNRSWNPWTGS